MTCVCVCVCVCGELQFSHTIEVLVGEKSLPSIREWDEKRTEVSVSFHLNRLRLKKKNY